MFHIDTLSHIIHNTYMHIYIHKCHYNTYIIAYILHPIIYNIRIYIYLYHNMPYIYHINYHTISHFTPNPDPQKPAGPTVAAPQPPRRAARSPSECVAHLLVGCSPRGGWNLPWWVSTHPKGAAARWWLPHPPWWNDYDDFEEVIRREWVLKKWLLVEDWWLMIKWLRIDG